MEEVVRGFRALASPEGFEGVAVTGVSPANGARGRVALTLASRAAVLDGEAVVTVADDGKVSLRFVKLDPRGKALLAHMVEHRDAEVPPPVPRHLVPLGAAPGTPGTARADAALATCAIEPLATPSVPTLAMPSLRPPAPTGPIAPPTRPELATTMRNAGARREPAPPTIRDVRPPAMPGPTKIGPAPAGPTGGGAMTGASPVMARPKREAQKTLMGMPALSPLAAEAPPPGKPPGEPPPPPELAEASSPALVVPAGTPPGVPTESVPVPRLRPDGSAVETGPTRPTRGPTEPSPVIVLAAQAIANSAPVQAPLDAVPTLPTAVPNIAALVPSRIDAAPSGPVDDQPTIPNDDIQTDVAFALPDLPGDDVDPVVDPPTPAEPVPSVMVRPQEPPPLMPAVPPGAVPLYGSPYYQQPPPQPHHAPPPPAPPPYYPPPPQHPQYPATAQLPALQVGPGYDWRQPQNVERDDDMTEMVALVRPPRRRWPVIAVTSAVIVIGVAVMVALAATSEDDPEPTAPAPAPAAAPGPAPAIGTAAPAPVAAPAVKTGTCEVTLTSSPDAAEVVVDGVVVGKTPVVHAGPCAGFTVTFRRERYQPQQVTVPASDGATTYNARLERPSFKVKVTSRPPGATVKLGGVDAGKTPVQLELPGYETTSIELTRAGYAPHTQRVYAGKSGQKVDVKLRPRRR